MNTLSYSEQLSAFQSFLSVSPSFYLSFGDTYFSIDNSNVVRLHNSDAAIKEDYDSRIKFIVNEEYQQVKAFDGMEIALSYGDKLPASTIEYYNRKQNSLETQIVDTMEREGTYRFVIPRASAEMFAERMRDKYIVADMKINGHGSNYNSFAIPYIKTKYRYSMI